MLNNDDTHFPIDNAHPTEVKNLLRCLSREVAYSNEELRELLLNTLNYRAQKHIELSTRRLYDLGFAFKQKTFTGKVGYALTALGVKVRNLLELDHDLFADVMHYAHYDGLSSSRKLFWSYKYCCEIVWKRREIPAKRKDMVAEVQAQIARAFPEAYSRRIGGNFNEKGIDAWKSWVNILSPSPFKPKDRTLHLRERDNFELSLLALDHVYRARGYRYGDPVVLDDQLLDEIARVFFLDPLCCRRLLDLAARVTRFIELRETFAGTAVKLVSPYTIERI